MEREYAGVPCLGCLKAHKAAGETDSLTAHKDCLDRLAREPEVAALKKMLRENNICPYGVLPPGSAMGLCQLGFPGCACMDAIMMDEDLPNAEA